MLSEIHSTIRQLVHTYGQIDPLDVGVAFDTPSETWVNSLTRPTISLFLFDVQENTEARETNMHVVRGNGRAERRMPPRRIDLSYMVSALTADVEDEHQLLWRVLATFMKHSEFPRDLLSQPLKSLQPALTTRIAAPSDSGQLLDLWNALGTKPHPALCYIVTAPLDLDVAFEVPLVLTKTSRYRLSAHDKPEVFVQIGGVIRDREGRPIADVVIKTTSGTEESTTNPAGQYLLRNVPEGPITLTLLRKDRKQKRVEVSVPAASYDIVLDE
jgi:Pvc16 N-terminal domain/Carboxypeptidase regulatory-like domain